MSAVKRYVEVCVCVCVCVQEKQNWRQNEKINANQNVILFFVKKIAYQLKTR